MPVLVAAMGGAALAAGGWSRGPAPDPILITHPSWVGLSGAPQGRASAEEQDWLDAGVVPGEGTRWEDMTTTALLDLRRLTAPNGAVRAGAADRWSYVWPRDSAFAAVALARAGHREEAVQILRFLAGLRLDREEGFEARYHLSGVGTPDDRGRQSDGVGWALWALDGVGVLPDRSGPEADLRALLDRCAALVLRITEDGARLPPASPDYWEMPVWRTSLGTVAPLLAGLRASERLYASLGETAQAQRSGAAARRLARQVGRWFGPGYERFGRHGGLDAAVAMMMPPFAPESPAVARAWAAYQHSALRAAGGLAPGTDWKQDGVSWTPETGLVALTAAASGRRDVAERWLDWLDGHRSPWGSLPEKVTARGRPAGPAPLAWTASLVVLAAEELQAHPGELQALPGEPGKPGEPGAQPGQVLALPGGSGAHPEAGGAAAASVPRG